MKRDREWFPPDELPLHRAILLQHYADTIGVPMIEQLGWILEEHGESLP